jgi:Na+-transporting methylmalonyl-CoA/oxaloacetate decarboxylase gamma subunit
LETHVLTTLSILIVVTWLIAVFIERFRRIRRARANGPARPPTYELIKRIESADAVRVLEILRGDHGLFRFDEMTWRKPDIDDPYEEEGYWAPTMCSGLYESTEAAERDARAEIPWLRQMAAA